MSHWFGNQTTLVLLYVFESLKWRTGLYASFVNQTAQDTIYVCFLLVVRKDNAKKRKKKTFLAIISWHTGFYLKSNSIQSANSHSQLIYFAKGGREFHCYKLVAENTVKKNIFIKICLCMTIFLTYVPVGACSLASGPSTSTPAASELCWPLNLDPVLSPWVRPSPTLPLWCKNSIPRHTGS